MLLIEKIGHATIFRKEFYQVAHYKIIHYSAPGTGQLRTQWQWGWRHIFSVIGINQYRNINAKYVQNWEQLNLIHPKYRLKKINTRRNNSSLKEFWGNLDVWHFSMELNRSVYGCLSTAAMSQINDELVPCFCCPPHLFQCQSEYVRKILQNYFPVFFFFSCF